MKRSEQKRRAAHFMKLASEESDPEVREALEDLAADYIAGRIKETPRRRQDCKTFEDACRFVLKSAHLEPDYSIVVEKGVVARMEWFGREFSDKHVALLQEFILMRGLQPDGLAELRLEATRISAEGVERLRRTLSQARITIILPGDKEAGPSSP